MYLARVLTLILAILTCSGRCFGYSVLTHEGIVDLLWTSQIVPLLQHKFPDLTADQINEAHAYAYGGSVIQDLGYYPFGSRKFSDLVHYVRSGDFVAELVAQSDDPNEFAFALGAMAHFVADVDGHPAVNEAVSICYPKLRAKYGRSVTYAQNKSAHLKTEFGFDTMQVAKNRYAPEQYHDFIGFEVSQGLLERVFPAVYGIGLKDALPHQDLAIGSYRWAISQLIPHMTKVALEVHKKEIMSETPNFAKRKFLYNLSRTKYEQAWGRSYQRPGFGTRFLVALLRLIPKVGPLRAFDFNNPTPKTEDLYIKSINKTVDDYRGLLEKTRTNPPALPDADLDSGLPTKAGEYSPADDAYAKLITTLASKKFAQTSPELRQDILKFYSNAKAPIKTKKNDGSWQKVQAAVEQLKAEQPAAPDTPDKPAR
jgi:hypothetical protein